MKENTSKANPLMNFARTVECSVKLPSNGNWYDDGMVKLNPIGELNILPMVPKDEIIMKNSEALLSGDAMIEVIKSCCPEIKEPRKLFYPDVNVIMLGIQKATYGNDMPIKSMCPKCVEKMDSISNDVYNKYRTDKHIDRELIDKEIEEVRFLVSDELKKHSEINQHPIEVSLNISDLLGQVETLPEKCVYEMKSGIKIHLTPILLEDKIKFSNMNIQHNKIITIGENRRKELIKENEIEVQKEIVDAMTKSYEKIVKFGTEILTNCINKVELPDGSFIFNKSQIREFIENTNSVDVDNMKNEITRLTEIGLPQTIDYVCPVCNHEWKGLIYGFNASDFFGRGSWF